MYRRVVRGNRPDLPASESTPVRPTLTVASIRFIRGVVGFDLFSKLPWDDGAWAWQRHILAARVRDHPSESGQSWADLTKLHQLRTPRRRECARVPRPDQQLPAAGQASCHTRPACRPVT